MSAFFVVSLHLSLFSIQKHNNLFSSPRHGLRSSLSRVKCSSYTLQHIICKSEKGKSIITMYDLPKASVSHDILLSKCLDFKNDQNWFYNFLSGRKQSFRITNCMSDKISIIYGIPQRTVLVSSFLLYMLMTFPMPSLIAWSFSMPITRNLFMPVTSMTCEIS